MRRMHLPIVEPCAEDWSAMVGDERRRHCSSCDREVVHLSAMTVEEAREVLARERVCVRYGYDADDTIVFARQVRAVALASALVACTAATESAERPRASEVPQEWQSCEEEPEVVEEPGQYEEEIPQVVELPGGIVEIEVPFEQRILATTVTVLEHRMVMGVPLARKDAPGYLEVYEAPERAAPRHLGPLDSWEEAPSPEQRAGVVPWREEE